jgi:type III restriction enzyme
LKLDPRFLELWEKIKHKTKYRVNYSTEELIKSAAKAIKEMDEVKQPLIMT